MTTTTERLQIIERFEETDVSVGTRFYKLEVTEAEKKIVIQSLKLLEGLEFTIRDTEGVIRRIEKESNGQANTAILASKLYSMNMLLEASKKK